MRDYHERLERAHEELDQQNTRWNAQLRWDGEQDPRACSMAITGIRRADWMHQSRDDASLKGVSMADMSDRLQQRRGEIRRDDSSHPRPG